MALYTRDRYDFLHGRANAPKATVKSVEMATKEEVQQLEKKWEELRNFARDTRSMVGDQLTRLNNITDELGLDGWGHANRLRILESYIEHIINQKPARKGARSRRIIVKSGGQTVEVTRNG